MTTSTTELETSTTSAGEALAAGQCPQVSPRPRPRADRPQYVIDVEADPTTGRVSGTATVRFTPDLPTDRLVFRLWPNGPRPAGSGVALTVGSVTDAITGAPLIVEQSMPTLLVVRTGEALRAGVPVEVKVEFKLEIPGSVRDRWSRSDNSLRAGTFYPLLAWQPGVGWAEEPATSAFAEATTSPVADYRLTVRVPAGFDVLASGVAIGNDTWIATAVRDVALSVGRFEVVSGVAQAPAPVTVTVGAHAGTVDPAPFLTKAIDVLEAFSARFGPYPWTNFTLAITPSLSGGIEFPGYVMQGPDTLGRTTSHEIGHMWFYGLVGNNQARDPWLDEGLASYAEATFEGSLAAFRARDIPGSGEGRTGSPMTYWESHPDAYYASVYIQGAVAVASLGETEWVDCALRQYVAANAHQIATPSSFLDAMATVFPEGRPQLVGYGING